MRGEKLLLKTLAVLLETSEDLLCGLEGEEELEVLEAMERIKLATARGIVRLAGGVPGRIDG